jgi:hypothetical protein
MNKKDINLGLFAILSTTFIMGIILATYLIFNKEDPNVRGTFGDMFGAANALFTGLSFVGIIVTILLQRRDINEQRYEMTLQSFESAFFNLLNIHRETVFALEKKRINKKTSGGITVEKDISSKGTAVFIYIFSRYIDHLPPDKKFNDISYLKVFKENWEILGHYFRSVEILLFTIDNLDIKKQNNLTYKQRYVDILKSQLSEYETALIFYHFLSSKGLKFKEIAEKYNFFEFINDELITDDKNLYSHKAFFR